MMISAITISATLRVLENGALKTATPRFMASRARSGSSRCRRRRPRAGGRLVEHPPVTWVLLRIPRTWTSRSFSASAPSARARLDLEALPAEDLVRALVHVLQQETPGSGSEGSRTGRRRCVVMCERGPSRREILSAGTGRTCNPGGGGAGCHRNGRKRASGVVELFEARRPKETIALLTGTPGGRAGVFGWRKGGLGAWGVAELVRERCGAVWDARARRASPCLATRAHCGAAWAVSGRTELSAFLVHGHPTHLVERRRSRLGR